MKRNCSKKSTKRYVWALAGIRYWAPDYEGWYTMSMFEFSNKVGTAKTILKEHKDIAQAGAQ